MAYAPPPPAMFAPAPPLATAGGYAHLAPQQQFQQLQQLQQLQQQQQQQQMLQHLPPGAYNTLPTHGALNVAGGAPHGAIVLQPSMLAVVAEHHLQQAQQQQQQAAAAKRAQSGQNLEAMGASTKRPRDDGATPLPSPVGGGGGGGGVPPRGGPPFYPPSGPQVHPLLAGGGIGDGIGASGQLPPSYPQQQQQQMQRAGSLPPHQQQQQQQQMQQQQQQQQMQQQVPTNNPHYMGPGAAYGTSVMAAAGGGGGGASWAGMNAAQRREARADQQRLLPRRAVARALRACGLDGEFRVTAELADALGRIVEATVTATVASGCAVARRRAEAAAREQQQQQQQQQAGGGGGGGGVGGAAGPDAQHQQRLARPLPLRPSDMAPFLERAMHLHVPGFGVEVRPYRRPAASALHRERMGAVRRTQLQQEQGQGQGPGQQQQQQQQGGPGRPGGGGGAFGGGGGF